MIEVFVAAGSNVEPEKHLSMALRALAAAYGPLTLSPAYRNPAVGFSGADFINLVVGFRTSDDVATVRRQLQKIEAACERPPDAPKWAPRTMDLDILLYGSLVSDAPGLVIPRPDLAKRPYMLKPMADIAPDVRHPTLGKTMSELWQVFDGGTHPLIEVSLDTGGSSGATSPRSGRRRPPESGR
jgi:2-amino-4-hydroxy-6-hydroxymethyldihydropteridine diphosphokinase